MNNNNSSGGIGFTGALFLVFLVLKLTDVIDWPWKWVFAPLWIPAALGLSILVIFLIGLGVVRLLETKEQKNIRKAKAALKDYSRSLR